MFFQKRFRRYVERIVTDVIGAMIVNSKLIVTGKKQKKLKLKDNK